jgi:nitrous oxidase accessory protein
MIRHRHHPHPPLGRQAARAGLRPPVALAVLTVLTVLALALPAARAAAADWNVPGPGTPTLAAALERARDGDRIVIAPGTHAGRVVVTRAVRLEAAAGGPRPVIDGGGAGRVLELRAPGSAVRGLTLRNSGDRVEGPDACLYVHQDATGARVLDNRLEDCAFGVWVNGTAGVELAHNVIRGRPHRIFSDRGNGINLWQIRDGHIHDNDIARTRDGVYLSVTVDSVVARNRMRDLRFGVHYMYSDHNRVEGNVTCDSQVGMALMFSKRLEIRDNVALRNRDHGILFRSILDSRIEGNRVEGNHKGLFLNDASFNEIHGNRVADNAIGVHITGGSGDNRVTGNAFVHNAVQVRYAWNYPVQWDDGRAGNYWSDYLGWDLDGDRVGDRAFYASGRMDRLVFRYPLLKVLASSPVVVMMQALEARFPVLRPPGVVDRRPALRPAGLRGAAAEAAGPDEICGAPRGPVTTNLGEAS